jgi:glycosyltransferase involved in cell wall biosynthesis
MARRPRKEQGDAVTAAREPTPRLRARPEARTDLLLYVHSFSGGGAERVTVQLANHWRACGLRVELAVNVADGPLSDSLDPDVPLHVLGRRRGLTAGPALARLYDDRRPRAVAAALTTANVSAAVARRLARWRPRVLVTEHNHFSNALRYSLSLGKRLTQPALIRLTYPMADVVAAVSEAAARDLDERLGRPPGSTLVLHNPIWPAEPNPDLRPGDVHPWFASDTPTVLSVGRLTPQKNHANLLEAVAIARRARALRLILLGDGPLRAELEARARALGVADAVAFEGFRDNVADYLAAADLFALSSDLEGLPLALLEALKAGTPVVSTDCVSGPREILVDGTFGRLVPVRDPSALASAMLETLADPPDPNRLKMRADDFSIDAVARRYESALFPDGSPVSAP